MAQKTDTELKNQSLVIRNETTEGGNTRQRHDDMNQNIIDSKPNNDKIFPVAAAGTVIKFDVAKTYGSVASPASGNITLDTADLVVGMVQHCLHNSDPAPTFASVFKRISVTEYVPGVLNTIYFHAVSTTRIEYTVSQEQED